MIKYCQKCFKNKNKLFPTGYIGVYKDELQTCTMKDNDGNTCGCELVTIDFPNKDLITILRVSESKQLVDSMIKLYQTDIIEYELKMSQFKEQQQQINVRKKEERQVQKSIEEQELNTVKCPKCGSTAIATVNRGFSIITGFIGSGSARNVCQKCGHKWDPR